MRRALLVLLSVGLLSVVVLLPATAADWPQFHRDERNRGVGDGSYRPYNAVWWTVDPGVGRIEASPVAADGVLVVAGSNGKVVALDASTGKARWNHTMARGVVGTPAIDNGWLYVVDEGGTLKSFDLQTGSLHRTASVGGATMSGVTVHEGSVYVGNEKGQLYRFEAQSLTQAWRFDTGSVYTNSTCNSASKIAAGPVRATPVVYKGQVIFGSFNNHVYSVSEFGQGELKWVYKAGDLVLSSPVIDQDRDRVLVGSYDRKLVAFNVAQPAANRCTASTYGVSALAAPVWTYTVPSDVGNSAVRATPAISGTTIVVGALNGHVYGVQATNGRQLWDHDTGAAITGSPAVANGTAVVPNDAGRLVWLHLGNGTEIKRHESEAPLKASPALVQDRTYIATLDGKVSLLGASIPKRPDLAVDPLQRDGQDVIVTVRNIGDGAAEAALLRLHLDDQFLADLNVSALAPGATQELRHGIDVPPPFGVRATVDPLNAVAEADEDNNGAHRAFDPDPVGSPPPGSETTSTTTSPADATTGPSPGPTTDRPNGIPAPGWPLLLAALAGALLLRRR